MTFDMGFPYHWDWSSTVDDVGFVFELCQLIWASRRYGVIQSMWAVLDVSRCGLPFCILSVKIVGFRCDIHRNDHIVRSYHINGPPMGSPHSPAVGYLSVYRDLSQIWIISFISSLISVTRFCFKPTGILFTTKRCKGEL